MSTWKPPKPPKPIYSPHFWRARIDASAGEIRRSVYRGVGPAEWDAVNAAHALILSTVSGSVLDCGCGYGALVPLLPQAVTDYLGVDLSPDFVAMAAGAYPGRRFQVADLRALPLHSGQFDLAVCRSIEGMVVENCGAEDWLRMQREILRVADAILLLSYSRPSHHRVIRQPTTLDPVFD